MAELGRETHGSQPGVVLGVQEGAQPLLVVARLDVVDDVQDHRGDVVHHGHVQVAVALDAVLQEAVPRRVGHQHVVHAGLVGAHREGGGVLPVVEVVDGAAVLGGLVTDERVQRRLGVQSVRAQWVEEHARGARAHEGLYLVAGGGFPQEGARVRDAPPRVGDAGVTE